MLNDPVNAIDPTGLTQCDIDRTLDRIRGTFPDLVIPPNLDFDLFEDPFTQAAAPIDGQSIIFATKFLGKLSDSRAALLVEVLIHEAIHQTPTLEQQLNPTNNPDDHPDVYKEAHRRAEELLNKLKKKGEKCQCPEK